MRYTEEMIQAMFALAERFFDAGRLDDAELLAHELRRADPMEEKFYRISAIIACAQGRHDYAYNNYKLALVLNRDDPINWLGMGLAKLNMGCVREAKELIETAKKLAKHDPAIQEQAQNVLRLMQ